MKTCIHFFNHILLSSSKNVELFLTKVVQKIKKTRILCSTTFFPKIVPFMR